MSSSTAPERGLGLAGTDPARPTLASAVKDRAWSLVVLGAMAVWVVVLFAIVRGAFGEYRIGRFDLGNMVQAVWSTANGRLLESTEASGEQIVRLGSHFDPFLVLLAPLWLVWPSPLALAFAQVAVVSLGALPVFWLGRRHLGSERAAGLLALAYLAYPWVAVSAAAAIHPVTFAIPLLLFCVWFLDDDRLLPFAACALLVMSTGELMGAPIGALGIWYALARGRRRAGALIALAGVVWTALAVYVFVPAFAGGDSIFYGFYDEVGGSPLGVVRTLFTDPLAVLGALTELHDVVYLVWLGLPLLFLFLLSPGLAAVALPQLLANGLSDYRLMTDPRYHSVAAIVPFLVAATVYGIARLDPTRRTRTAGAVLVSSAALAFVVGPWPRAVGETPLGGRESLAASHIETLAEAVRLVPEGVPVTASSRVGAHLSARRYHYSVPVLRRAEWVVVDLDDPWVVSEGAPLLTNHPEIVRAFAQRLRGDASWAKVFERDGVLVFRRSGG
jgi:uncharacterized membrane protein